MSPLRQEAFKLLEDVPEENLAWLIKVLQVENNRLIAQEKLLADEKLLAKKQSAYENLQKLIHNKKVEVPADFDYKEELTRYREERFGNANLG